MLLQIDTLYLMISSEEKEIEKQRLSLPCHGHAILRSWVWIQFQAILDCDKCDWSKGGSMCGSETVCLASSAIIYNGYKVIFPKSETRQISFTGSLPLELIPHESSSSERAWLFKADFFRFLKALMASESDTFFDWALSFEMFDTLRVVRLRPTMTRVLRTHRNEDESKISWSSEHQILFEHSLGLCHPTQILPWFLRWHFAKKKSQILSKLLSGVLSW